MKRILLLAVLVCPALASAVEFKVATGSDKGTYTALATQFKMVCGDPIEMSIKLSTGSLENLSLLLGNEVSGAFVQTDVLFFKDKTDNLSNVRTLLAFHPEEVHFVAKSAPIIVKGERIWSKDTERHINSVSDLAGFKVGAAGGSYITAQLIRLQSEVAYSVEQFDNGDAVMAALNSGTIQAAVFVGGQPLGAVSALDSKYKLLPIGESVVDKLKNVYRPARLNYPKITASSISTVATDALLVTRDYKTPAMVEKLRILKTCVLEHLAEFQETPGSHPKWQSVDPNNNGKWANKYEFPKPPVPTKKKGK